MGLHKKENKAHKNYKKLFYKAAFVLSMAALLTFWLVSLEFLSGNAYGSRSVGIESLKLLQFTLLTYLTTVGLSYINKGLAWLGATGLFFLQTILVSYFLVVKKPLDFMFFSFNKNNLTTVLAPYTGSLLFALMFAGLIALVFLKIYSKDIRKNLVVLSILLVTLIVPFLRGKLYLNETLAFFSSAFHKDAVIELYQIQYQELLAESMLDKKLLSQKITGVKGRERPAYLDNIIFLQLESLNADLMTPDVTPNFYNIASEGFYVPNFYANGVQTILGQENTLCALPSSFYGNLNFSGNDKKVLCLPEVFKQLGYKTAFFKTYDLNFTNTGEFMRNIGFAETHVESIMRPEDPTYHWGYREDVFYNRAFDYISDKFQQKNNFLFLEVGPTNHWPFKTPEEYTELVPHKKPVNQQERLKNTMFLQDKHLAIAWQRINEIFPQKNFTVIIVGDHSWPAGKKAGNEFCGSGAFEENFRTGLAIIAGDGELGKGEKLKERFSQMDIMPSLMELLGLKFSQNKFKKSLFAKNKEGVTREIILVQPFSERYLAFLRKEYTKAVYNSQEEKWDIFNLQTDPGENNPFKTIEGEERSYEWAEKTIPLVSNKQIVMHALGGIAGHDYTNSKEALAESLKKNRKIFEIDVNLSSDNKIVLSHATEVTQTEREFLATKTKGGFTPATLEDVLQEMRKNKDMLLMTDIKHKYYSKVAEVLFKEIKQQDPQLIARVIPQVYNEETFLTTRDKFGFQKMIYTLYKEHKTDKQVVEFVSENLSHIPIVVMSKSRFNERLNWELRKLGVKTFVHTLNEEKQILSFRKKGVYGVFTDYY